MRIGKKTIAFAIALAMSFAIGFTQSTNKNCWLLYFSLIKIFRVRCAILCKKQLLEIGIPQAREEIAGK